jgi:hypothetical protein
MEPSMAVGGFEGALTTVAACGGAGAFFDFWLGRAGDRRLRSWMETWWLRMSYVRIGNFGREEALFAVAVMDRIFGPSLWSRRRLISTAYVGAIAIFIGIAIPLILGIVRQDEIALDRPFNFIEVPWELALFAVSVSLTQLTARGVAGVLTQKPLVNFILFIFLAGFQYVLLCLWVPMVSLLSNMATGYIRTFILGPYPLPPSGTRYLPLFDEIKAFFVGITNPAWEIDVLVNSIVFLRPLGYVLIRSYGIGYFLAVLPNLLRLAIALSFVISYLLKPLQTPLLALIARIIESDKPIFTLLFTGIAALAKAIEAAVEYF